jgi:hypothetical protein
MHNIITIAMENYAEEEQVDTQVERNIVLSDDESSVSDRKEKDNKYSPEQLEILKNRIEMMEKLHHIKILSILKKNGSIKLNENKSGVFINLTFLPKNTIDELYEYTKYVDMQEYSILDLEAKQDEYKILLDKEDKDNTLSYDSLTNKRNL